jgi:hypothetical protein
LAIATAGFSSGLKLRDHHNRVALAGCAAFDLDELGMSRGLLRMIPARVRASGRVVLEREPA